MSIDIAWFPDYGHLMAGIFSLNFDLEFFILWLWLEAQLGRLYLVGILV